MPLVLPKGEFLTLLEDPGETLIRGVCRCAAHNRRQDTQVAVEIVEHRRDRYLSCQVSSSP